MKTALPAKNAASTVAHIMGWVMAKMALGGKANWVLV
jgi:hypothetical protein